MKAGYRWVIPCEELRPLILEWAQRNEYSQVVDYHDTNHQSDKTRTPITLHQVLEHRSGVPRRRISGILNAGSRQCPNVSFDTADRLLCGMDMVDEWQGRLAAFYAEPIEVSLAEAKRLNQKEKMSRDLRDPQEVGAELLGFVQYERENYPGVTVQPSGVADRYHHALEACPDWTGDGHMSNDPAEHHSGTSQIGNEKIGGQA